MGRLVAYRESTEDSTDYLVEEDTQTFLMLASENKLITVENVDSLLARGYWEDPEDLSSVEQQNALDRYEHLKNPKSPFFEKLGNS